jgi:hypothetical protein
MLFTGTQVPCNWIFTISVNIGFSYRLDRTISDPVHPLVHRQRGYWDTIRVASHPSQKSKGSVRMGLTPASKQASKPLLVRRSCSCQPCTAHSAKQRRHRFIFDRTIICASIQPSKGGHRASIHTKMAMISGEMFNSVAQGTVVNITNHINIGPCASGYKGSVLTTPRPKDKLYFTPWQHLLLSSVGPVVMAIARPGCHNLKSCAYDPASPPSPPKAMHAPGIHYQPPPPTPAKKPKILTEI